MGLNFVYADGDLVLPFIAHVYRSDTWILPIGLWNYDLGNRND